MSKRELNTNTKNFITGFLYNFGINAFGMIVSLIVTLLLPKYLGVNEYGKFQLYILYASYVAFTHLGSTDGMFLRYGGKFIEEINKFKFRSYITIMIIWQSIVGFSIIIFALLQQNKDMVFLYLCVGTTLIITNTQGVFEYLYLATGDNKSYTLICFINKCCYLLFVFFIIITRSFVSKAVIVANISAGIISLVVAIYLSKDFVFGKRDRLICGIAEIKKNISVGISLISSNAASLLIVGFVRLSIERLWNVEEFSKVSLTLSVSNLLMVFVNAVARVLFPILRRTNETKQAELYLKMRIVLMLVMFGIMLMYYPVRLILQNWLPQYSESLKYMAMLFPICVFDSKMSMIISTYMKTLRLEKRLLLVNIITLALSVITTAITAFWLHNLDLVVFSIVVLLAFRCIFAELLLSHAIDIKVKKDIALEIVLTVVFIVSSWTIGGILGVMVYGITYVCYLLIKRNQVKEILSILKLVLHKLN